MENIGGGISSLKWMKNMGMEIGNTTGGVALRPHRLRDHNVLVLKNGLAIVKMLHILYCKYIPKLDLVVLKCMLNIHIILD